MWTFFHSWVCGCGYVCRDVRYGFNLCVNMCSWICTCVCLCICLCMIGCVILFIHDCLHVFLGIACVCLCLLASVRRRVLIWLLSRIPQASERTRSAFQTEQHNRTYEKIRLEINVIRRKRQKIPAVQTNIRKDINKEWGGGNNKSKGGCGTYLHKKNFVSWTCSPVIEYKPCPFRRYRISPNLRQMPHMQASYNQYDNGPILHCSWKAGWA